MAAQNILQGKRILAVDDEQDVLEVVEEQLDSCILTEASDFEGAAELMREKEFDLVILDIMGVRGFDLLDLATSKKIPAVMLTAHSMTAESLQQAVDKGAVSFLPKDELLRLRELIVEILGEVEQGRTHWEKLQTRLGPKFKKAWGELWDGLRFPSDNRITW